MKKTLASLTNTIPIAVQLLVWLLLTAYLRALLLPDEGRYANVVREMLNGDWLVPTLNGMPFFHKPPLLYWLDMLAVQLFGMNALTVRAGSILGAWACGMVVFVLLKHWHGVRVAVVTLIILATSPLFYFSAQYNNHDMLVSGLISIAILLIARAVEDTNILSRRHLRWAYAVCALAVLTKGLIGIVIPGMVIVPWLVVQRRWKSLGQLFEPVALGIFLLMVLPWFVLIQLRYPGFFHYFFIYQHVDRFLMQTFNNVQPAWFFFVVLPVLTLPWAVFGPAALNQAWRERTPLQSLSLWWLLATLLFFSLMHSKLVGYILPAVVPWVILLSLWLAKRSYFKWIAAFAAMVCVATAIWIARIMPDSHRSVASMLSSQMAPDDRVIFIGDFFYDIPFYARLAKPVIVIEDWHSADMEIVDNWRLELKHAANFNLAAGADRLIDKHDLAALTSLACHKETLWFVVQTGEPVTHPELFNMRQLFSKEDVGLYRSDAKNRLCANTPAAAPP